ncbi:hypothetical protein [Streptomyces sp. NPDC059564]|uniref:hypothetical protein n=1 Tax=Streptomyces sp. NPDC059564 TaxID=3346865 RepID=UPI00369B1F10
MEAHDLDRYFGRHRRDSASGTKVRQAAAFAVFLEFLELRHKAGIHAATSFVVESPLDEMNRPRGGASARLRSPLPEAEVTALFGGWRCDMEEAPKYAPAARNYTASRLASLIGPRISGGISSATVYMPRAGLGLEGPLSSGCRPDTWLTD